MRCRRSRRLRGMGGGGWGGGRGGGGVGCWCVAVPRISRAQSMDALSSQSNIAGYRAALMGAQEMGRFYPMLMTAAGTIRPATVLVLGAGVAGGAGGGGGDDSAGDGACAWCWCGGVAGDCDGASVGCGGAGV